MMQKEAMMKMSAQLVLACISDGNKNVTTLLNDTKDSYDEDCCWIFIFPIVLQSSSDGSGSGIPYTRKKLKNHVFSRHSRFLAGSLAGWARNLLQSQTWLHTVCECEL